MCATRPFGRCARAVSSHAAAFFDLKVGSSVIVTPIPAASMMSAFAR
jgi:hypothetical protein